MALAIEPMLTAGDPETVELDDGWTVVTASGSAGGALGALGRDHRRRPAGPHPPGLTGVWTFTSTGAPPFLCLVEAGPVANGVDL